MKAHQVPDASRTAKGLPLINLISIDQNELVTKAIAVDDFTKAEFLVMATRQGRIKRTALEDYASVRSSGIIAMLLEEGDQVAGVRLTNGKEDIIMVTEQGQGIRFSEDQVRPMGRATTGVNGIKLRNKDAIVAMDVTSPDADLLVITSAGFGKRTSIKDYPVQGRAGGGVIAINLVKGMGIVAAARLVKATDDLMIISEHGLVIRLMADSISRQGRNTRGVSLMNMREGDRVASIACIDGQCDPQTAIPASLFSGTARSVEIGTGKEPSTKADSRKKEITPTKEAKIGKLTPSKKPETGRPAPKKK